MKKRFLNVFVVALMAVTALVNTGCNHDTNIATDDSESKTNGKGAQITFNLTREDFAPETEVNTRGVVQESGRVVVSTVTKMSNGLDVLAEVVENTAPKTRAANPANSGNYIILAYKDGQKKAEWDGYFDGSVFKVNNKPAEEKILEAGQYKFYAFFKDKIHYADNMIKYDLNDGSVNAVYAEQNVTIPAGGKITLDLTMKPAFARVQVKFKGFSTYAFQGSFNGTIDANKWDGSNNSTDASKPIKVAYESKSINLTTGAVEKTPAKKIWKMGVQGFGSSTPDGNTMSHVLSNPCYFFEGTMMNQLSFTFSSDTNGKIYARAARNAHLDFPGLTSRELERGKAYTLTLTLYAPAKYLFDNGYGFYVKGLLQEKVKKPVALVIDETKKIAIALKNLSNEKQWVMDLNYKPKPEHDETPAELNMLSTLFNDAWKETFHKDRMIKMGNNIVRGSTYQFQAFNELQQESYSCYLPGVAEWNAALKLFGVGTPTENFGSTTAYNSWSTSDGTLQDALFYQAGGTPLNEGVYWGAYAWKNNRAMTVEINRQGVRFGGDLRTKKHLVRPFYDY